MQVLEPEYGIGVNEALDRVEFNEERAKLWDSIVAAIQMVCDNPGSKVARRYSLPIPNGTTIWRVPIPAPGEDQRWSMLWEERAGTALIHYIGVWPPPEQQS
jgi:hypothetical protein